MSALTANKNKFDAYCKVLDSMIFAYTGITTDSCLSFCQDADFNVHVRDASRAREVAKFVCKAYKRVRIVATHEYEAMDGEPASVTICFGKKPA